MTDTTVPYDEWLAQAGLIEPEFVQVPDGFYTERLVIDHMPPARVWKEGEMPMDYDMKWHTERLDQPIPKYRKELRWRPWHRAGQGRSSEGGESDGN